MLAMAGVPTFGMGRSWEHCHSHVSPGAGRGHGRGCPAPKTAAF